MIFRLRSFLRLCYYFFRYSISPIEYFSYVKHSDVDKKVTFLGSHKVTYSVIGEYSYFAQNAIVSYTSIGKYCSIGPNFICGWGIHPINGISTSPMFYSTAKQNGYSLCDKDKIEERKKIIIGNDVFIGANVVVLDGVTIGDGAVIGAGAVVSKNIPPYAVAIGCPITIVKYRFDKDVIQKLQRVRWWEHGDSYHDSIEKNFFDVNTFLQEHI